MYMFSLVPNLFFAHGGEKMSGQSATLEVLQSNCFMKMTSRTAINGDE